MDEIVGVEIKQEEDPQEFCSEQDWLEILPKNIKTDFHGIVKTEDQYCMNYDEVCSNDLPSENGPILKEENASLGVAEANSVNKINEESAFKQWVKEEQGIERRENALDVKIFLHQKLDLPKMSPKAVAHLNTEIDLDNIVVKSEDQFCINCDENSSDNQPSENGLVLKDYPSVKAIRTSETLEFDYDSDMKNLINKIDYDQQDVSREAFFQENVELQTEIINLKQVEKKEKGNRNKTPNSKEKKHKCHYCDFETVRKSNLKQHILMVHEKDNATVYHCEHCTFKTLYVGNLHCHLRAHEEKALYKCPGCHRGFHRKAHFDNHLLKNHDNFQHLITSTIHHCKFCTYKSMRSKHLVRHMAHNHNKDGAEKFQCHKCDYFALIKCNLQRHLMVVHSNLRPYLCAACKKGFSQKISLDSHILNSHKENAGLLKSITHKIHQCTFCLYKTMNSLNLHRHMKSKHKQTSA